jgi:hypothetical protein
MEVEKLHGPVSSRERMGALQVLHPQLDTSVRLRQSHWDQVIYNSRPGSDPFT